MKRITIILAVLALSACTINGVTFDPNRSTPGIAPDYLELTPDEQNIWATMTDAQRERAILFITSGATLVSSLGSR